MVALLLAVSGCANLTVSKTTTVNSTNVTLRAHTLLANKVVKGLELDGTTKTGSKLFKVTSETTEPSVEGINATTAGLGTVIGAAAKAALGGVAP